MDAYVVCNAAGIWPGKHPQGFGIAVLRSRKIAAILTNVNRALRMRAWLYTDEKIIYSPAIKRLWVDVMHFNSIE
ncbi:hypothetical protein HA050_03735 [Iodobacter sp. HSC-16F04]|uniref:Uncharacterized protein n=1 Tax=Iodobacter violaceini TaxID=3044271 RepID=A0ABX0KNG3_9NEIS|nr:hypothetical protein [Iodobacter violacea]NHQ85221.1 hypothetical protein [Iodobacter violacea]